MVNRTYARERGVRAIHELPLRSQSIFAKVLAKLETEQGSNGCNPSGGV
jgi:hypothetical protein